MERCRDAAERVVRRYEPCGSRSHARFSRLPLTNTVATA